MKYLLLATLIVFSFSACSKEKAVVLAKTKVTITKEVKPAIPCESKEDLLKKIAEKQKADSEKGRGFSLQGGNTGCSIK